MLKLSHFKRHKRKTLKKVPGKTTNYPFHKPEENHPPGKDSTKKISNLIGKAANYAGSAKSKKVRSTGYFGMQFKLKSFEAQQIIDIKMYAICMNSLGSI